MTFGVVGQHELAFSLDSVIIAPMQIAGYSFEHVCDIEPVRHTDGSVQLFLPQDRYENTQKLPLNRYGTGPFCRFKIANRVQDSGVYVLTTDEEIRYVGE